MGFIYRVSKVLHFIFEKRGIIPRLSWIKNILDVEKLMKRGIKAKFEKLFGMDVRSLALVRVCFASLIIIDLINRGSSLKAYYTDYGVLPRHALFQYENILRLNSLHLLSGTFAVQFILFLMAGLAAFCLLIGYRTRLVSILSWFFLVSLHNRNFLVLQGGDILFRMVLFWGMFLPWGRCYSVDSLLALRTNEPKQVSSLATVAYLLQIAFVYTFSGLLKTGREWTTDGTAIYYALNVDQFTKPFGYFLLQFPSLLKIMTFSTWYLECFGALFLFFPFFSVPIRMIALCLFVGLHIGIQMSMAMGLFHWIALSAFIGFLPSEFWDFIARPFKKIYGEGLTVYYDHECKFCKKSVEVIKRLFLLSGVKAFPDDSNVDISKKMQQQHSWVIVDSSGKAYFKFEAMLVLMQASPVFKIFVPILRLNIFANIGNKVYEYVSHHRNQKWFTKESPPETNRYSFLGSLVLAFLILYVFIWNVGTLTNAKIRIPPKWQWLAYTLRIDQQWNMFAPRPMTDDGWYIVAGQLKNEQKVDLFKGGAAVVSTKPKYVYKTYKNQRWQKYMMNLWNKKFSAYRLYYGRYLCREWNAVHDANHKLQRFVMIYMREDTPEPGCRPSPPQIKIIWRHQCF